jgi:hypothetical protein
MSSFTPAFWTFWIGFLFPVLWLVGGWHFTNIGEMPPKYTIWEWFFWQRPSSRLWSEVRTTFPRLRRTNSSGSSTNARSGKVYPALPQYSHTTFLIRVNVPHMTQSSNPSTTINLKLSSLTALAALAKLTCTTPSVTSFVVMDLLSL